MAGAMDGDRRATLETAVEFLTAARELNDVARQMTKAGEVRRRNRLRALADRFQDRGLQMMVRDLAREATGG